MESWSWTEAKADGRKLGLRGKVGPLTRTEHFQPGVRGQKMQTSLSPPAAVQRQIRLQSSCHHPSPEGSTILPGCLCESGRPPGRTENLHYCGPCRTGLMTFHFQRQLGILESSLDSSHVQGGAPWP